MEDRIRKILEEAVKIYFKTGDSRYAINKANEIYKEKDLSATDQSKQIELDKNFKDIISPRELIDNGEVFDKINGK